MTGTLASLSSKGGGLSIPTPVVHLRPRGVGTASHDRAFVGGMSHADWEALKDRSPQVWLYRYKRGYNSQTPAEIAYNSDNTRRYVHPADWRDGNTVSGRHVGGGAHTSRNGTVPPVRQTEWDVTAPRKQEAEFNPERWFLNPSAKLYNWPVVSVASATGDEHTLLGQSGQSGNDTGSYPSKERQAFCNSTRTRGTQVQWFAFAFVVKDVNDPRDYVVGPLSEVIKAEIWPRVKVTYGNCRDFADRGRKIRLRHS